MERASAAVEVRVRVCELFAQRKKRREGEDEIARRRRVGDVPQRSYPLQGGEQEVA